MTHITLNSKTRFVHEPEALKGAVIAAKNVMHDMELIFGEPLQDFDGKADRFYAASPAIVLEKIAVYPKGTKIKESYMGPNESYIQR